MEEFVLKTGLVAGRPEDSRPPVEQGCYDFLDKLGVEYHRVDHDPAFHIETCHAV